MECLDAFCEDPVARLNDLNVIVPKIIETTNIEAAITLLESLTKDLVTQSDYKYLVSSDHTPSDKIMLFIAQRVRLML